LLFYQRTGRCAPPIKPYTAVGVIPTVRGIRKRKDIQINLDHLSHLIPRARCRPSPAAARTSRLVDNFLRPLTILEFVSSDATTYAQVRAKLERAGTPIGPLDTLIAAQAVARKLTLVSNNQKEFGRVAGLNIANWARA
jgi:tRNA(fMet)-specific endonuclease VapC